MILGVDVGGTFTDAALLTPDALVTAKAPTTPDDQSEGVLRAVERGARQGRRTARAGRALRARDDRGHQRPARGAGGAHRAARHRGLHRHRGAGPAGAGRALPALRLPSARRSCPRSCACRCPSAPARTECCARSTSRRWPERLDGLEYRGRRGVPALGLPPPGPRAARGRARGARPPRRARVHLARDRRGVPRVRALRDHGGRRRPLPAPARLPGAARRALRAGRPP